MPVTVKALLGLYVALQLLVFRLLFVLHSR